MTQTRTLFAEFQAGGRLYGSSTDMSDNDLVRIWYPSLIEAVSNRPVTISQKMTPEADVRNILLGEFVMSLGKNNENTLLAIHYAAEIGISPSWYLNRAFTMELFKTGEAMQRFAKNAKIYAHGYRYKAIAHRLALGEFTGYPLHPDDLETYRHLRTLSVEALTERVENWKPADSLKARIASSPALRDTPIETFKLAEWVWDKYAGLYDAGIEG